MDPIKNTGAIDYSMVMPPQKQEQNYDDYTTMPQVYDPVMEEKKASASNGSALKSLASIGIAGLALWGAFKLGQSKSKVEKVAGELTQEAKTKMESLKTAKEAAVKAKEAYKNASDNAMKITEENTSIFREGKAGVRKKVKNALDTQEIKDAEQVLKKAEDDLVKAEKAFQNAENEINNIVNNVVDDTAKAVDDAIN